MSKQTPEDLRKQFKLIQGGLPDTQATPVGEALQNYFESLSLESKGFIAPDLNNLDEVTRRELEYMASDPSADEFDFTKGPFLIDPEP